MVRTKIICTLGPSSTTETVLRKMILAGMDIARLNFSHGKPRDLSDRIDIVRRLNAKYKRHIKFLGDLQGHRIRIGDLPEEMILVKRKIVWLTQGRDGGKDGRVPFDYHGPLDGIKNGRRIFIDDGNIALEVIGRRGDNLKTKVVIGGVLKGHKGVNIPGARLRFGNISRKDIEDISFCRRHGVEYVAQSFVQTGKDVTDVRSILGGSSASRVIAKIEDREGIRNIDGVIKVSDGIMIARGDMGVSLPVYEIPIIQKMIIKKCNRAGKFVITATQMLESMTENLTPTRAEATDVANAILDGTDYVMLSAESAVGKHPVETVTMMNEIIKFTEKNEKVAAG